MSRRLGDDPLARAKAAAAKVEVAIDAQASKSARNSSGRLVTRGSYNDVFFRRRGEEGGPVVAKEVSVAESPEITEISEIPEIREVAAAPIVEEAPAAEIKIIEPRTTTEEVVAMLSATSVPIVKSDPTPSGAPVVEPIVNVVAAPQAPNPGEGQPKAEKEGGFFKRLFGKFGK